jgi:hypothetical protein
VYAHGAGVLSLTWPPLMVAQNTVCECWTSFHTDMADCLEREFDPVQFIVQCFGCSVFTECFLINVHFLIMFTY